MGNRFLLDRCDRIVLLTALYTVIGGMKSVLYTSVLQTPILLIGSLVILVLSLKAVGGWDQVLEACRVTPVNEYGDSMINLIRSNRDANFPWLGVSSGLLLSVSGIGVPISLSYSVYCRVKMKLRLGGGLYSVLI